MQAILHNNGWNNVFVGANTDVNGTDYFNVVAIGAGTICTGVNQARIGNSATTFYWRLCKLEQYF